MTSNEEEDDWEEHRKNVESTRHEIEEIFRSINEKMDEINKIIGKKD